MKNISWLVVSQGVRLLLGLLIGSWLARSLGPEGNGVLGTAAVVGALAGFVADFGLRQVLIKEFASRPAEAPAIFGTAVRMMCAAGLVMTLVAGGACWLLGGARMVLMGLVLSCPLALNGSLAVLSRWDAAHESRRTAQLSLLVSVVGNLLRVVCILTGTNLIFAAAAIAIETLGTGIVAFFWARRHGWLAQIKKWDAPVARRLLTEALPLFISHSGTLLLLRLDQLMVFRMAGEAEAGLYAAATRLSEVVYAAGPIVIMVFMPKLAELFVKDHAGYERQRGLLFAVFSVLGYGTVLAWWVCGRWMVDLLYGPEFARAADVLAVHSMAALPYLHGELRGSLLVIERQSASGAQAAVTGVVLNLLLNLWFIPRMGALGAAWATAITYVVVWMGASLVLPRLRGMGLQQLKSLTAPFWLWRDSGALRLLLRS